MSMLHHLFNQTPGVWEVKMDCNWNIILVNPQTKTPGGYVGFSPAIRSNPGDLRSENGMQMQNHIAQPSNIDPRGLCRSFTIYSIKPRGSEEWKRIANKKSHCSTLKHRPSGFLSGFRQPFDQPPGVWGVKSAALIAAPHFVKVLSSFVYCHIVLFRHR